MGDNREFEVLRHILTCYTHYRVVNTLRTLNVHHLFVHGYHWLPLATIDLVGDNREFEVLRHILSCYTHYEVFNSLRT